MPPNINKKQYRLADMGIQPETGVAYPDPDEDADFVEDRIDLAGFGVLFNIREWRSQDGVVEQFALMLNVTPEHHAYERCCQLKGDEENFSQVKRTDTWHSTVHSHQYYIDSTEHDRETHTTLYGGDKFEDSRRAVNGLFQKHYSEFLYEPYECLSRWEDGRP